MIYPDFICMVTRPNEGGYIPGEGHVVSTLDAYRIVSIEDIENRPEAWCMTDTSTCAALGRLIDGPITSKADIELAESAIRSILLYDFVDILVPSVKTVTNSSMLSYARFDAQDRKHASYAAMNVAPCRELLLATELVEVNSGLIVSSTNKNSRIVGKSFEDKRNYQEIITECSDLVSSLPIDVQAASYFGMPEFVKNSGSNLSGFIASLYNKVNGQWMTYGQVPPPLFIDIKFPPFISIILSRANNREDIPNVLKDLRDELSDTRNELKRLNRFLTSTNSQAEINATTKRINESFDAIVAESQLGSQQLIARKVFGIINFLKPIADLFTLANSGICADPEKLFEIYKNASEAVLTNSKIVSRSVSASKFSELLRVESLYGIIETHFSEQEKKIFRKDN